VLRILDKCGIKPTIAMDQTVANYPFLVNEVRRQAWKSRGSSARRGINAKMSADTGAPISAAALMRWPRRLEGHRSAGWARI
jgi:hypothetical protein